MAEQTMAAHLSVFRISSEYKLMIREQPKHSRMCGVGEKGASDACHAWQRERMLI